MSTELYIDRKTVLLIKDIVRLEGTGNYTKIFAREGKSFTSSKTLKTLAAELPELPDFIRINKTHLINAGYITGYQYDVGGDGKKFLVVSMTDGSSLIVSRNRELALRRLLTNT